MFRMLFIATSSIAADTAGGSADDDRRYAAAAALSSQCCSPPDGTIVFPSFNAGADMGRTGIWRFRQDVAL